MKDKIESVCNKYGVDKFIISAMISKTTNVGADLDRDGFSTWNNISHFGIMRVPVS